MRRKASRPFVYFSAGFIVCLLAFAHFYKEAVPQRKAREIWREHERVVIDAAAGRRVHLDDFADAVLFFERLTGIYVPSEHSTLIDAMPNKDTASAVEPLRRWYQENKYDLYWDEQRREVRLMR
jgi:hypothetical protein